MTLHQRLGPLSGEVIHVLAGGMVLTAAGCLCHHRSRIDAPGNPGWYVVLRPSLAACGDYRSTSAFYGPYPSEQVAQKVKTSALYLGVAEHEPDIAARESCRVWMTEALGADPAAPPPCELLRPLAAMAAD